MSELSPKARALLQSGRDAFKPTAADRERIQTVLRSRLGATMPPPHATMPVRSGWQLMTSAVVGAGVLGGALFFAFRHPQPVRSAPMQATPSTAQAAAPVLDAPIELAVPADSAVTPAVVVPTKAQASAPRPAQDSLAQEVALLSRATSDLHSGHAADALKLLDEHRRKFPNGVLTEERRAARAQALCSLGRVSEAQVELAHLTPQSPVGARAQQVCGAKTTSGS